MIICSYIILLTEPFTNFLLDYTKLEAYPGFKSWVRHCSAPSPTRARHIGDRGGAQARALSDYRAVPGLAAASEAPSPASHQSPCALTSGPRHTSRRPCVRASCSPPASGGPSTAPGPGSCAVRRPQPAGSGSHQPLLIYAPK